MSTSGLIILICAIALFYTYVGYPLFLQVIALVWRRGVKPVDGPLPSVTIIIPARNAEHFIREKLVNTLAINQQDASQVEIVVVSDESTDATDDIVREYAAMDVRLIRMEDRGGKECGQQLAIEHTDGEIILFTDVRAQLEPEALSNILAYFRDPKIGAVSSIDAVQAGFSGEGLYVRYEMWLRSLESKISSLVGLSGSCFAARRSICDRWHEDIPSDFFTALNCVRKRQRAVLATDVPCRYGVDAQSGKEFSRKVRTVLRGLSAYFRYWMLMNPLLYGFFSLQYVSHKLMRWLAPFFLITAVAVLMATTQSATVFVGSLIAVYLFVLVAGIAHFLPAVQENPIAKIVLYFALSNVAIINAWLKLFSGKRMVTWEPTSAKAS